MWLMKVVAVVQARMTSTRLPGKVLMEVLGKPLLRYETERIQKIPSIDEVVIATTTNKEDDPIAELCASLGVPVFRGSEPDVLSRYYEAAYQYNADVVVRFTADCPLIDPELSERVIRRYLDNNNRYDYCCTDYTTTPRGTDTEIFSFATLREAYCEGTLPKEREHVTYFIYSRPERYKICREPGRDGWVKYRLTVDVPEDFELVKTIIEQLYPKNPQFKLPDVISLLENNPELLNINSMIQHNVVWSW
jgi:spore coat polysaccharide biosynthesis protein SpsF